MEEDWKLEIAFHWPHDRLALGWDIIMPDEQYKYSTVKIYMLFITITIDF
tara:strand:+ start:3965 stop:4114 length:150 start_codon:yes stop_codon:yes gene_type:complete